VTITAKPNAGLDQTVSCAILPGGSATLAATGAGAWSAAAGNPGTATITTPTSPATTITNFSVAGTYDFIYTNGSCSDTAAVTVTAKPNAGPDQTASCVALPGGSVTMAATGIGTWSAETGNPGTAIITAPSSPTTTITTFSAPGIYSFIWTSGSCTDTATVTITSGPNAGPDQSVSCVALPGGSVTMAATGAGTWSASPGNPGTAIITNPASPTTTITTFSVTGTYLFIYSNGACSDTAIVTVSSGADAGPDQIVACTVLPGGTATMAATGMGIWTAQTGNPGTAIITTPTSPTTTITNFSAPGIYYFIWTTGSCSDTASVTVTPEPDAGPDQTVSCAILPGGTATMAATGLGIWTDAGNNPGTSTITTIFSPTTTITDFSVAGTYYYVFTNGLCSDTAAVIVTAKPDAGPDLTVPCTTLPGGTATMDAVGVGIWTAAAANPGTAVITAPGSPTTTITNFSTSGIYSFIWTVGTCSDTATITVNAQPDAGPDQTVGCAILPGGSATMAAIGTGTWSAWPNNPGTAIITNPNSPTTTITTFSVAGTYEFIYTNGICTDTALVIVSSGVNAGPDQTVSCVILPGGVATMAATGTGLWTELTGNPGTDVITSPTSPTTTITTFSAAGTYYFSYSNGSCADTAAVIVTAKPYAGTNVSVCQNGTATLTAAGTGTWSVLPTNPAQTTIVSPTNATTVINGFNIIGTYGYVWTVGICTDTAFVFVNAAPTITPVVANITCNNAVGSITAQTNGSSPFTYQWSDGNTTDSITTATAGTSYTVTVTDANQCTSTATASVGNLITPVNIADSLYDVTCYGYNNGKIVLYVSPAGQYTYGWSDNETTDSISGLSPGTYTVVATDSNGCHNTATYTITSPAGADTLSITPVDTLTTLGDTIQLNSNLTGMYPAITYSWTPDSGLSCNNCPNPMLVPVDTNRDVYKLVITYNNGCTATDSAIVTAKANDLIGIPTAFTPNGDGKNDTFFIPATSVKEFKMNIYDRWGQQIFSTTDVGAGWDGTFKGKGEPEEIYMYFFTIVYLDGKSVVKEGTLMLQR
jgi:gliding motility-associated-like protein